MGVEMMVGLGNIKDSKELFEGWLGWISWVLLIITSTAVVMILAGVI
jgi:hypothetical protein